jgi:hypothetical protein
MRIHRLGDAVFQNNFLFFFVISAFLCGQLLLLGSS